MRKKLRVLLVAIIFILAAFSGCGSNTSASRNSEIKILLALNETDTFRQTLVDAALATAQEQGVQLDVKDAEGSIENQVSFLKNAESDGYDVIICSPVSADTIVELKASAGKLPIIFINTCPDDKHLKANKYIYVGSSERIAGQYQAEYILNELSDKNEINVVVFKGPKNHSATNGRTSGAKKVLESSGKTIHYVFDDYADWESDRAKEMFEVFLSTGQVPDCVICNNDSMALGVIEACKMGNISPSSLLIVGVDATAEGCEAIENGDMAFTVYQSAKGQGEVAVQAAICFAKGESINNLDGATDDSKYIWVPFEKVDSNNVSNYH